MTFDDTSAAESFLAEAGIVRYPRNLVEPVYRRQFLPGVWVGPEMDEQTALETADYLLGSPL